MTVVNAERMLAKVAPVQRGTHGERYARIGNHIVSFSVNGRDEPGAHAICFHVKRVGELADSMTDYFPGSFFKNLTRAIRYAQQAVAS